MTIADYAKEIEKELNEIVSEFGFQPQGQSLESKIRLINEKLSFFGFSEQALECVNGYVDRLKKEVHYPDLLRLAAWTYLLVEQFQRTKRFDTSSHMSPRRMWPIGRIGTPTPPDGAAVFENDRCVERSSDGEISVSDRLATLLVEARQQYEWPIGSTIRKSQQGVIDLEEQTSERLKSLDAEKAQWIVLEVHDWAGGRKRKSIEGATTEGKAAFEASIRKLVAGDVQDGLRVLSDQPGVGLVIAAKIYRFCCPESGAAVDRHSSYFFNSLGLCESDKDRTRCTGFKREWENGKHQTSRLAAFGTSRFDHNLSEYLCSYLPLLVAVATDLNRRGIHYRCAASTKKKPWRPADVEMAAYQWWSRNGPS